MVAGTEGRKKRLRAVPHAGSGVVMALALLAACATSPPPAPPPAVADFDAAMQQGQLAMARHDYGSAVQALEGAVARRPDSPKAHNYLGISYQRLRHYERARRSFERAIALDPSFAAAYNNLGGIYTIEGAYEKAVPLLEKALSLAPDMGSALYNLGTAQLALGRLAEAKASLARAVELDPNLLESRETQLARVALPPVPAGEVAFLYATLFAAAGDAGKTVEYLEKARTAGFHDWKRIAETKEFESVRSDPRVQAFLAP